MLGAGLPVEDERLAGLDYAFALEIAHCLRESLEGRAGGLVCVIFSGRSPAPPELDPLALCDE
jgi:hypothetical protein